VNAVPGIDDPVVNAIAPSRADDLSQYLSGPRPVIGMLVGQQQLNRGHYLTALVAVQPVKPV
jgi:hypothetical protein